MKTFKNSFEVTQLFHKKILLINLQNSQEKTCDGILISNIFKVQATLHVFPLNFVKRFRITDTEVHSESSQTLWIELFKKMIHTTLKMKFSIKNFFSKCDQIRKFLRIWSHLLKKFLMENFIFLCSVRVYNCFHIKISTIYMLDRVLDIP